eukprot:CAMPEP_0184651008 /NCGR_PEP_ID=MMETSP0308-20130426/8570_1 /TAXON_ID=38269 /ORGANISM="Gloeochaete witrockiana, Strain SAG 46.84" /LENGTH=59 /DNA_ID=CAMNT_0027084909 /DNA_START=79 /DNA_END=255 /DNA_ORIENTATION=+
MGLQIPISSNKEITEDLRTLELDWDQTLHTKHFRFSEDNRPCLQFFKLGDLSRNPEVAS